MIIQGEIISTSLCTSSNTAERLYLRQDDISSLNIKTMQLNETEERDTANI